MERRLPVENDIVIILEVPLYLVARLDVLIGAVPQICQVNEMIVRPDDVAGAGPGVRPVFNQLPHIVDVLAGDSLWNSESERHLYGHSELVESENRVRRDHRTGGEVNSLPHQISSETTFLTSEASSDRLERLP